MSININTFLLVSLLQLPASNIIYFCRADQQHVQICKNNTLWQRLIKRDFQQDYQGSCSICEYTRLLVLKIIKLLGKYITLQEKKVWEHDQYMEEIREDWAYEITYTSYDAFRKAIDSEWERYEEALKIAKDLELLSKNIAHDQENDQYVLIHHTKVPSSLIDLIIESNYNRDEDPETLISLVLLKEAMEDEIDDVMEYLIDTNAFDAN